MDVVAGLRTFLRVAETGSFSSAALDLGLTQPAVSRQISSLEEHYSTRLLHRSTNGLSLTVEGEQMIPMARKVIDAMEALGDATAAESGTTSGRVRISLPAPLGLHISERLPALLKLHPHLTVETAFREEPSDLVGDGIDIEVRLGDVTDSSLICRRLGWTTAFLVASPAYVAERGLPSGPEEIARHDCICYSRGGKTRAWVFADGADQVRATISPRMVFNNATAVYRATIAGGGLAILSHILVAEDIASSRLINILPSLPPARLPITAVYVSRRNLPTRVRTVLDFLADAVRKDTLMAGAAS